MIIDKENRALTNQNEWGAQRLKNDDNNNVIHYRNKLSKYI